LVGSATSVYADMFVATGNGEGTQEGTGMHITWLPRPEYFWPTLL
jgi:hypothetical protein